MRAYPDLASGQFLIVANFEEREQGALFRLAPPTALGTIGITHERSREETGRSSLKVAFSRSDQELVIEDVGRGTWSLPRDWSRFHIFLMSVYVPRPVTGAAFTVASGPEKLIKYRRAGLLLSEGWNLLRFDVGDMAERIDVADVREIRFGFPGEEGPLEFFVDDLILAQNARDLVGSPTDGAGRFFVRTEGRRVRTGVTGQFELAFSNGRIVQWFDLARDPNRIRNLAGSGPIGPVPVGLTIVPGAIPRIAAEDPWSETGPAVESFQKIVEASAVRAVIWGEWRFGVEAGAAAATEDKPYQRWVYTVYPTGRVYVETALSLGAAAAPRALGALVACAEGEGFRRLVHAPRADARDALGRRLGYALFARPEHGCSDLVFALHDSDAMPKARPVRHGEEARQGVLFYNDRPVRTEAWAGVLAVWPADLDGPRQVERLLADYVEPTPIEVLAGRLVRSDPGDLDEDGFNESRGHYTIAPSGRVARIRIDGRVRTRHEPVIIVTDTAGADVWAYVDGIPLETIGRDVEGNAVFQVPGLVNKLTLVEVTVEPRRQAASATP
jgi:hypothetical protein